MDGARGWGRTEDRPSGGQRTSGAGGAVKGEGGRGRGRGKLVWELAGQKLDGSPSGGSADAGSAGRVLCPRPVG